MAIPFGEPPSGATPQTVVEQAVSSVGQPDALRALETPKTGLALDILEAKKRVREAQIKAGESLAEIMKTAQEIESAWKDKLSVTSQQETPLNERVGHETPDWVEMKLGHYSMVQSGILTEADTNGNERTAHLSLHSKGIIDEPADKKSEARLRNLRPDYQPRIESERELWIQDPNNSEIITVINKDSVSIRLAEDPNHSYLMNVIMVDDTADINIFRLGYQYPSLDPLDVARRSLGFAQTATLKPADAPAAPTAPQQAPQAPTAV